MKVGKRLTAFFLAGMLILTSNVTGFAEETTADQQPEEAKSTYLLTVDAEDSTVTVKGDHVEQKTASTYQIEAGSEVAASVAPTDGKEVKEVRVNEEQLDLADGTVTFSMPEKDSLLQVILKEKEQAAEEAEEPKQEVSQTEEWELPDEKEYQQRLQLAKALGVEDWLDEEGWLDDGYFAGKSDLELTESGVVPLIRNSITNPKMSRAVTLYNKVTYNNISSAEFAVDGKLAFCLEYAKTTPPAGTATGTPTEITNSGVKAAMYYGYNGPAAAQYSFSSTSQAVLVTATLSSYYYSGQSPFSSATSGNAQSTGFTAFFNFVEAHKASVPSSFKAYAVSTGSNTQHLGYWTYAPTGTMYLTKTSANTAMTDNNSCYSLGNAVYGVYSNSICTTKVGTLITGTNGVSNPISVNEGTYYVKETSAPKGYKLDTKVHTVKVTSGQTAVVKVQDAPLNDPSAIELNKIDADTGETVQGAASLAGAQFTIKYYKGLYTEATLPSTATRTWVVATKAVKYSDGTTHYITGLHDNYKVSGDAFYTTSGLTTLPLGTITIEETKAPEGYLLDGAYLQAEGSTTKLSGKYVAQITQRGDAAHLNGGNVYSMNDKVVKGDIVIAKYAENNAEAGNGSSDLKRPLKDVKFHLTSKTTGTVYTIKTDDQGIASTQQLLEEDKRGKEGALPFDTYTVTEESPYEEYDEADPWDVTIDENLKTYYYILRNDTIDAPISVVKKDATTGNIIPVAGAKFQILDAEKNVISLTVPYPSNKKMDTWETDETGSFYLPQKLEYGTYYLREVKAPEGYLLNTEEIQFKVTAERDWENPLVVECEDIPAMGKIHLKKTDKESGEALAGAVFHVIAAENITTPDGTLQAAKDEVVTTLTTGSDGTATSDALHFGKYKLVETKAPNGYVASEKSWNVTLSYADQETEIVTEDITVTNTPNEVKVKKVDADSQEALAGVEFQVWKKGTSAKDTYTTGEDGTFTVKRLAPGTYCIQESKPAPGYELNEEIQEITVNADGTFGGETTATVTFTDKKTVITETNAISADTLGKEGLPKTDAKITDTVSMQHLYKSGQYKLKALLKDQETGDSYLVNGKEVTAEKNFSATASAMNVDVLITADLSNAVGKKLVVYEYLYQIVDGKEFLISSHEDIHDEKQTITIPKQEIRTTAKDKNTQKSEGIAKKDATIIDTVNYSGLIVGQEYTVKGVLMLKGTNEPLLVNGKEVTAEKTFVPEKSSGSVDVEFTFDASALQGEAVVVFEHLYVQDVEVASHTDIEDQGQTVDYPEHEIKTTAKDKDTQKSEGIAKKNATIIDTVSYSGLIMGQEYTVKGVLMLKGTNEPLLVNGKEVTAEKTFVPEKSSGSVDVEFTFDASALQGEAVVVFEHLYVQDVEVAAHTDIEDQGQTVEYPEHEIKTTAKDKDTQKSEGIAKKNATIIDTVSYSGLIIGQEYTVKGVLMLKGTNKPLLVNGKEITAEKTFVPEKSSGSVDIEFTFDASALKGESVVVFEHLYADGVEVASHTDINDKGQTVTYKLGKLKVTMPNQKNSGLITALKTGDMLAVTPYIVLLMLAGAAILVLAKRKKKEVIDEK